MRLTATGVPRQCAFKISPKEPYKHHWSSWGCILAYGRMQIDYGNTGASTVIKLWADRNNFNLEKKGKIQEINGTKEQETTSEEMGSDF